MRSHIRFLTAAVATISIGSPVQADLGDQLRKLLPDDGAADDGAADGAFGFAVAIDCSTAVVGSPGDAHAGDLTGAAYVLDTAAGRQRVKLRANDAEAEDLFGYSVGISGATVIVGSLLNDDQGDRSGSAYVFDAMSGDQLFKLLPSDGAEHDWFGFSVAISGTTAVVGARRNDDHGDDSGSAYVFDTTTGEELFKLLPDDGQAGDLFGTYVAVSGTIAIVGAYGDDDNGEESGSAYLFDTTTGQQIRKLAAGDGRAGDWFGHSVGISGDKAIVGAPNHDEGQGAAYLFDVNTGQQLFELDPGDEGMDSTGYNVGISGAVAIAGSAGDDENGVGAGAAHVFDTKSGRLLTKLLPDDDAEGDAFGLAVAISGTTAIAGAHFDDDQGDESGSAYLFDAAPVPCAADVNGDGTVGFDDILAVLSAWGSCP